MFSVYQHWDQLTDCVVGISYPPYIYDYIKNQRVRKVFYKIAEQTEEDYQKLIGILQKFNVHVLRPDISEVIEIAKWQSKNNEEIWGPAGFMQPRDRSIMVGDKFFIEPSMYSKNIIDYVKLQGNEVIFNDFVPGVTTFHGDEILMCGAYVTRVGLDLFIGSHENLPNDSKEMKIYQERLQDLFPDFRVHAVNTQGHADGSFCPVAPGLILSLLHMSEYEKTFPGWEVIWLENESWGKVTEFDRLKKKNHGKWWVPGEELNDEFTDFVEQWMTKWVGYVEESVFDVNMLIIDPHNVIVNGYNRLVWDALEKRKITPHICNFRHRYFWDGGIHCITSDLNRLGTKQDWFR